MLLITCPWCGPRAETEFTCGGEADIARPLDPENLTDEAWADYLFMRRNLRGLHQEQWHHSFGCRRWFVVERDTVTYELQNVLPDDTAGKPGE
jgi:sarcosine oxidase, subunit delta